MADTVLVLSHRHAFEADPVIDGLRLRGVPVFRFNANPEVPGTSISVAFEKSPPAVVLRCDGLDLSAERVGVAWLQQPPPFHDDTSTRPEGLQQASFTAAWVGALSLLGCEWLNEPGRVYRAANKILQNAVAQSVGFAIPDTLISNSPLAIRQFVQSRGQAIAKSLATPWFHGQAGFYSAYTKLVESSWLISDEELAFGPVIYQRFHERLRDYRIVVVGGNMFAAYSACPSEEQRYDVRRNTATTEGYYKCDVPQGVDTLLSRMLSRFELDFCSADVIETVSGQYLFLDLNATGAWWWVDRLYGGSICEALAELLLTKLKKHGDNG